MPEISEIVNVQVTVQSSALSRKGFNSLLLVGSESDFDTGFDQYEVRKYVSYQQVSDDADILSGDLDAMLQVAFAQNPAVSTVYVTRIDADGLVHNGTLNFDETFVSGNSTEVFIDNREIAASPIAFDTDNAGTLAAIAAALEAEPEIESAVSDGNDTITCTGAISGNTYTITTNTTGGATQPESTFNITQQGTANVDSDDLDAVFENNNEWFGYAQVYEGNLDIQNAASWIASNDRYGFFRIIDVTRDLALNSNFNCIWYTDNSYTGTQRYVDVAIASRILALIPGSYTAAFKRLELVSTVDLSATDESTLRNNNVNQYSQVAGADITWDGKASAGGYIDTYIGVLYLEARIAEDVFAVLVSRDKVPYTNDGINLIVGAVQGRLNQSVEEGYLTDNPAPVTEAPDVTQISDTDKSNRLLPDVTFLAYTAGAIHQVEIRGTVIA